MNYLIENKVWYAFIIGTVVSIFIFCGSFQIYKAPNIPISKLIPDSYYYSRTIIVLDTITKSVLSGHIKHKLPIWPCQPQNNRKKSATLAGMLYIGRSVAFKLISDETPCIF